MPGQNIRRKPESYDFRFLDQIPNSLRREWKISDLYTQWPERVFHRARDRSGRGDGGPFSGGLLPERGERRRHGMVLDLDARSFERRGLSIVRQRQRQQLALRV